MKDRLAISLKNINWVSLLPHTYKMDFVGETKFKATFVLVNVGTT